MLDKVMHHHALLLIVLLIVTCVHLCAAFLPNTSRSVQTLRQQRCSYESKQCIFARSSDRSTSNRSSTDVTSKKRNLSNTRSKGRNSNKGKLRGDDRSPSRRAAGKTSFTSSRNGAVRVNKCLMSLSRRAADEAVLQGRVTVNGKVAKCGDKVMFGDEVRLDGRFQHWEQSEKAKAKKIDRVAEQRNLIYLKYWKPEGVTCTSDPTDPTNIISAGQFDLFPQRLFTVGRLDKMSTGLILLTSDGRVNNALLKSSRKREKVYEVQYNKQPTDQQLSKMANGVVITTPVQRDLKISSGAGDDGTSSRMGTRTQSITAKTLPCQIRRTSDRSVEIVLKEGRNRQIRRMAEAVGLQVVTLHRTKFAGITLKGLASDNWLELDDHEIALIQNAIRSSAKE